MFTLKLKHIAKDRTKVLSCGSLDIVADGCDYKIAAKTPDDKVFEFVVSNGIDADFNVAYVENSSGATTQVIRPRGLK